MFSNNKYYQPVPLLPSSPPPSSTLKLTSAVHRRRCAQTAILVSALAIAVLVLPSILLYRSRHALTVSNINQSWLNYPPLDKDDRRTRPTDRLARLNAQYDPTKEGFGVGNADLGAYSTQLREAYQVLFGAEKVVGKDLLDHLEEGEDESELELVEEEDGKEEQDEGASRTVLSRKPKLERLWSTTSCALDPTCFIRPSSSSSSSPKIPTNLYMTSRTISPEPESVSSWRSLNPANFQINLFNDADVFSWIKARFPLGTIFDEFSNLPINILQFDLFRLLVLYGRGGVYTDADTHAMKTFEQWGEGAVDLTDEGMMMIVAASEGRGKNGHEEQDLPPPVNKQPPALVVGIEWSGRTETNVLNPLYTRTVGVVQWTFGATAGHPVVLDSIRKVVRHSQRAMRVQDGEEEDDDDDLDEDAGEGPLHFDPEGERMVLEWSGPAVLSDALARYLRTRWGVSLESVGRFPHPVRVGDVLILPIGALNARTSTFLKWLDWALGRNLTPWTKVEDCVQHLHAASWWGKKVHPDTR